MKTALRILDKTYFKDDDFKQHLEFVKENLAYIDEVTIFLEYCHHAYMPLSEVCERMDVIKERIAEYRRLGIKSVGINVLNVLGQTDEAWDVIPKSPVPTMVSHSGRVSPSCFCPNTEKFREYTRAKLTAVAEADTDFIWLDDDIRMKNHGQQYVCFCPECLKLFNEEHGFRFTREELVRELDKPENTPLRSKWVHHNSDVLNNVLKFCREVILSVNPKVKLGFMTTAQEEDSYAIHNIGELTSSLGACKLRPGGGFYTDDYLKEGLYKAVLVGRQVGKLNKSLPDIQYEYENYPCITYAKSALMTDYESCASLMSGCNGILYNSSEAGKIAIELVKKNKKKWDAITEYTKNSRALGVNVLYNELYAARKTYDGSFFRDPDIWTKPPIFDVLSNLAEIGIPMAGTSEDAAAYILFEDMIEGFSDEDILAILSKGVYMDGYAAEHLTKRGFGKYIGAEIKCKRTNGIKERFRDDDFNESASGLERSYALTFFSRDLDKCTAWALEPLDGARVLADMYTILGEYIGPTFTLFENELGGRIAISGYVAYNFLRDAAKMEHFCNVIDWISRGAAPIRFSTPIKVMPIVRESESATVVFLGSCGLDKTQPFSFDLRGAKGARAYEITDSGEHLEVKASLIRNALRVEVGEIAGWNYRVFVIPHESR